nr:cyclic nucleotide-binding domain-containing protein [Anaerolineae bacterium]
ANIASSELGLNGNLRISFHRGQFARSDATWRAAYASALMVNDIQSDVIDSFCRSEAGAFTPATPKSASDMQILLEETHDNFEFAGLVLKALSQLNPDIVKQVQIVPGLNNVGAQERNFYLSSPEISWSLEERRQILTRIGKSGHKTDAVDLEQGFKYVKLVELYAGDVLIEAGLPADFVYIPLSQGLRVYPLGGYSPFDVHPWMPLGSTAVIRGAPRNATVVAVQSVRLLMIPKEVYLRYWHQTYSRPEFVKRLQLKNAVSSSIRSVTS